MNPIRVMCIDDSAIVAESLGRRLRIEPDLEWLGWMADPGQLFSQLEEKPPDVLLVDVDMPGVDAFALVAQVKARRPEVFVAMLTGHVNAKYLDRAFVAGATGYICKDEETASIISHIHKLAAGDVVISPGI